MELFGKENINKKKKFFLILLVCKKEKSISLISHTFERANKDDKFSLEKKNQLIQSATFLFILVEI